ncbi:germinal center-associated signaling and motility-like protein isoform X2 [Sciurus carolinensis]|uniref:germinal center-associated signaling and motility-like protein isoform X2 n=1 Tax=Sciurus carolinensis TaxID=30640 RepID=UPI001FB4202C|nr:germinal center-associated signaling and motility-like protein isoform X2 [Sciurus carolinensis]
MGNALPRELRFLSSALLPLDIASIADFAAPLLGVSCLGDCRSRAHIKGPAASLELSTEQLPGKGAKEEQEGKPRSEKETVKNFYPLLIRTPGTAARKRCATRSSATRRRAGPR